MNLLGLALNSAYFRFVIALYDILGIDALENGVWLLPLPGMALLLDNREWRIHFNIK
jgi:hypothetical protein